MPKNKILLMMLLVLALMVTGISCQKLETRTRVLPSSLPPPIVLEAIPLDDGQLIAATPHPDDPHWVVLWFQKPDKTIAVVLVNVEQGKVVRRAAIPRN